MQGRERFRAHGLIRWLMLPAVISTAAPVASFAQDGQAQLDEIIVTAQKREQSVQDIGLSITAIGGDELRRLQANDVSTIATQIPNVVATTSVNLPAFTIRGVGLNEFASNFDSPVAIHIDEVYKSKPYMASIPFFDIARVEVLKGPQGTLFGRNTTGGSVNFYTAEPTMSSESGLNFSGDHYGRLRGDGYVSGAVSEALAGRVSVFVAKGVGGPYENLRTGDDYGEPDQFAGRVQLKWQGEQTSIRWTGYGFRDKSETTPYESPGIFTASGALCPQVLNGTIDNDRSACLRYGPFTPPGDPRGVRETDSIKTFNSDHLWLADNTAYGTSVKIEHGIGDASLVSITSYDYFERDQTEDGDSSPYDTVNEDFYSRIKQFTQELRLAGKRGGFNYLIGAFFEDDAIDEVNSANLNNPLLGLPPSSPRFGADFEQDVRSFALFTHNEFEITPSVSLVAGARYTRDKTSLDGSTYLGANDPRGKKDAITPVIPVADLDDDRVDENFSFRFGVNWKVADEDLLYASIARGFRSGGYSVPFGGVITSFDPERLTAYELGYKTRLLERTLDLNASVYWYDYADLQANVDDPVSPIVPITRNIGSSRSYGAEVDATWRPTQTFLGRVGVSYLDAEYNDTDRTVTTYAGVIPLEGKRPVNAPKWTTQALMQKTVPVSDSLNLILQTDGKYVSKRFLESTGQVFDRADSYWIQNARIALQRDDGRWEVALWGKNIFDKEYLTYINNISFFRLEIYGDPASYGASASFKF